MDKVKVVVIAAASAVMGWLGILAIPVFLLILCNLIDYGTGIAAAPYRKQVVSSYKGMRGIIKKVCMWLLIVVGAIVDALINYGAENIGLSFKIPFIVSTIVAVWLIVNEIISILENIVDIGVKLPPFLIPLVKNIKKQVENTAKKAVQENEKDIKKGN